MYVNILQSKPHNSRYLTRYIKFITHCINNPSTGSTEAHHICPKSSDLFPEFKSFKKFPWNKVALTLRQHYLAHKLLWRAFGGRQTQAFKLMCERLSFNNSRCYDQVRKEHNKYMTEHNPNSDGKQAKNSWASATNERRLRQAELMREVNAKKKKPKELRLYKCTHCGAEISREEFCHRPPKLNYYCNTSCRGFYVASRRESKAGIPKPRKEGGTSWNKGLSNPQAAENGRKGAEKLSVSVTGRKRKYLPDGTWTWEYPK